MEVTAAGNKTTHPSAHRNTVEPSHGRRLLRPLQSPQAPQHTFILLTEGATSTYFIIYIIHHRASYLPTCRRWRKVSRGHQPAPPPFLAPHPASFTLPPISSWRRAQKEQLSTPRVQY